MKRNWRPLGLTRFCLVAMTALVFFACANESSAPPTPPAPPAFQPQTVVVQLGTRGGATTLISTSSGGWTRNGQPFTSGSTIRGENASSYRLTLANGVWTAEFVAPDPEPLALGTSGQAILLQAQEDGSFQLDGEPVTAGRLVEADNGNQYRLVLGSDGAWTAEFVIPAPQLVYLGSTGEALQLRRLEDGGFTIDGEAFAPGGVVEARNGNRYSLTFGPDGVWQAVYVEPDPQALQLGSSGDPPLLVYRQENGTFRANGEPLLGGTVVQATNGSSYRLILGSGGMMWQAVFIPEEVPVALGSFGGTVILTSAEDGTWRLGSSQLSFSSGSTVTGENDATYRLTLANGAWTADFVAPDPEPLVLGTSGQAIVLQAQEDGSFQLDGERVTPGKVVEANNGNMYRLVRSGGAWTAEFVPPRPQRVGLGSSGEARQVSRREDGGFTIDGEDFAPGGVVEARNGNRYSLTLGADGTWRAVYVVPEPQPLQLGTSGDPPLLVYRQENGTYLLNGEQLLGGTVVQATNGNSYRLVRSGGAWTAVFAPPRPQRVELGSSGEARQVSRREDGGFTIDGEDFAPGGVVEARNGNSYSLTLGADGTWQAVYVVPEPQALQLGTSGDPPLLVYRQENGTYLLNGEQLLAGRVVQATNGNSYRLTRGQGGMWQAAYRPEQVPVALGSFGGTVILTSAEDGTWRLGSSPFSSGDSTTGTNGFEYRLTLGADGWIVEALPMTVNVPVTGSDTTIALARLEDGSYLYDNREVNSGDTVTAGKSTYTLQLANNRWTAVFLRGEILVSLGTEGDSVTLIKNADGTYEHDGERVRSGSIVRSPTTQRQYRLRLSNGVWTASLFVRPIPGGGDPGGGDTPPVVAENILDALPESVKNFTPTGSTYDPIQPGVADPDDTDVSSYRGGGRYEDDTFVESVIRAIDRILGPIEAQGLADGTDSQRFAARVVIDSSWPTVKSELDSIFGTGQISFSSTAPQRTGQTDVDESVSRLKDLKEDLSDVGKFKDRFGTQITNSGVTGDQIYEARKRVLALGASTNTRFGVIATHASTTTAQLAAGGTVDPTPTAFAFSPLAATAADALPARGTARYSGRTWAIDSNQMLYSGSIELLASIAIEQVRATISNLRRSDDSATWTYNGKDVREIMLPEINRAEFDVDGDNSGSFTRAPAAATVVFDEFGGINTTNVDESALTGQFVGGSGNTSPGVAVIGTWSVGPAATPELNGSFGAEYIGTNAATLPPASSGVIYNNVVNATGASATISTTALTIDSDHVYTLSGLASRTTTVNNKTVTLRLRNTSLTRFGAWKLVDSSDANNPVTTRGVLTYSQLARTNYGGTNANYLPIRGSAQYAGRTVAVDSSGDLYDGSYQLSVTWTGTGGTISAAIGGLSGLTLGGNTVTQIGFQDALDGTTNPAFSTPTSTNVRYATGLQPVAFGGTATHSGFFLGDEGPSGPFAVVGSWSLIDPDDTTYTINGAFGADLVRAP